MRWKQFLTPVASLDCNEAEELVARTPKEELVLLDVRQPKEYRVAHLPGSKLIPLPELLGRLTELDTGQTIIVY